MVVWKELRRLDKKCHGDGQEAVARFSQCSNWLALADESFAELSIECRVLERPERLQRQSTDLVEYRRRLEPHGYAIAVSVVNRR